MPIPGSTLNVRFAVAAASAAYPSLATLMPITKSVDSAGQQIHTFALSVDPTQINMQCRKSPLIVIRPQNQEAMEAGNIQRSEAKFQVNFLTFINVSESLLVQWQVNIDGAVYQIKAVESDGDRLTTRLMISDEVPFIA